MVQLDRASMIEEYNGRILPRAIEANLNLIAALKELAVSPDAEAYEAEATKSEALERKRYCLDIARELYYLKVRAALYERNLAGPYPHSAPDRKKLRSLDPGSREGGYSMGDTLRFWKLARQIEALEDHYNQGRFGEALGVLEAIKKEAQ